MFHAEHQVEATKFTEVGYHGRDVDSIGEASTEQPSLQQITLRWWLLDSWSVLQSRHSRISLCVLMFGLLLTCRCGILQSALCL